MSDTQQCREWIASIREYEGDICTDWERTFLDDMEMKTDNDAFMSEKQIGTLKRIYNKLAALEEMEDLRKKTDEIMEVAGEVLSEKEIDFMGSVKERLGSNSELTPRQMVWFNEIYDKVCNSPF